MKEKIITYLGQKAKVNCDGKCYKAWGSSLREKKYDGSYKKDYELGRAPINPRSYEGGDAKPLSNDEFPNKWCVRECERCNISKPGMFNEPLDLIKF